MSAIICPQCRHLRETDSAVPAWQCPACGVAYAKVGTPAHPAPAAPGRLYVAKPESSVPWGKLLLIAAIAAGAFLATGVGQERVRRAAPGLFSPSDDELRRLAAEVAAGDIVMYSTSVCPHCTVAKRWLDQHGFAFTECNMSVQASCERQFLAFGGDGTPYFVVRGHHMRGGFEPDEFVGALRAEH